MLRTRVLTALILGPLVLLVAWFREPWLSLGVLLVVALALGEAIDLLVAAGWPVPRWATYTAGLVVAASSPLLLGILAAEQSAGGYPNLPEGVTRLGVFGLPLALFVLSVIGLAGAALRNRDPHVGLPAWVGSVFVVAWLALLGPMLIWVGHLAPIPTAVPVFSPDEPLGAFGWASGTGWLFVLFGLVWGCDTGAYFVGRAMGRRKLHEQVSPGKTVAGFYGGIVVAALVTALLGWLLVELAPPVGLLLGAVTAAVAQSGDLAKSLLKRVAGRKDSGNLFPGHGGALDRIDSLLFAAPMVIGFAIVLGNAWVVP